MPRDLNKVMLLGNLRAAPEGRYASNGNFFCTFRLLTSRQWRDEGGDLREETEGHAVICWGQLAEHCHESLDRGSRAYVEGRIQTRRWLDAEGRDRYTTEIAASDVIFLSPRQERDDWQPDEYQTDDELEQLPPNVPPQAGRQAPQAGRQAPQAPQAGRQAPQAPQAPQAGRQAPQARRSARIPEDAYQRQPARVVNTDPAWGPFD